MCSAVCNSSRRGLASDQLDSGVLSALHLVTRSFTGV